jgi:uncharacterized membrane protein
MEPTSPRPPFEPAVAAAAAPSSAWPREPRRLPAGRAASWWGEGWKIFTVSPLVWVGIMATLIVINVALSWIPLVGQAASSVLGPIFVGGVLMGCHGLAQGRPLAFGTLFAGFQSDRAKPLAILGLVMLALTAVATIAFVSLLTIFGAVAGVGAMTSGDPTVAAAAAIAGMGVGGVILAVAGFAVGVLFMMAWWFAPALVALNRVPPLEALKASFNASLANLGAIVLFLVIFLLLALVATLPVFLGWLVLGPVALGADYASWREVFAD